MAYYVVVNANDSWYVYGPFESRGSAIDWAEAELGSYNYHVAQLCGR